jgi:predicted anti-sigma-YlaC factor YlaD
MSVASEAGMDCELCEKSLVDLLYGELDETTSAQVRTHLEGCDGCRQAFEKLESGRSFARKLVI